MGRTSSNRPRKREAANESCVVLRIRSTNCAAEIRSTRHCQKLLQVQLSVRRRSGQGVAVHGAGRSARRACGGVDLLEKPARYVGSASWTRERPLEGVAHGRRACSTRNLTLPKPARGATTSEHIPQSTLIMGNNCAQSEHTDDRRWRSSWAPAPVPGRAGRDSQMWLIQQQVTYCHLPLWPPPLSTTSSSHYERLTPNIAEEPPQIVPGVQDVRSVGRSCGRRTRASAARRRTASRTTVRAMRSARSVRCFHTSWPTGASRGLCAPRGACSAPDAAL